MAGDIKVAVVSGALDLSLSQTTNFTKSGFGTPLACIVICGWDTGDDANVATESRVSIGLSDFTSNYCITHQDEDAQTKVDCDALKSNTTCFNILDASGSVIASGTAATTTDGVALTVDNGGDDTNDPFVTVIMYGGADLAVSLNSTTIDSSENGTATISHSGFTDGNDKLIFFIGTDISGEDSASTGINNSFGVCHATGTDAGGWTFTQRCIGWASDHGNVDGSPAATLSTEHVLDMITEAGGEDWALEVTELDHSPAQWTVTTRDAGAGAGMEVYSLALDLDDRSGAVGSVQSPISGSSWFRGILTGASYLFDASDAGPTDPDNVWSNDSNAFTDDGNLANILAVEGIGSATSEYLGGEGTNAPASGAAFGSVFLRLRAQAGIVSTGIGVRVTTDGASETLLSTTQTVFTALDDYYFRLATPAGGWTYAKLQALEIRFWASTADEGLFIERAFAEPTVDWTPQYVGLGLTHLTSEDSIATNSNAGGLGISSNTGSSEETCHSWYNEDAEATTDTANLFRSRIIDFRDDGTDTVVQDHSHSSFDNGGWTTTINTENQVNLKRWFYWAIEEAAAVGDIDLDPAKADLTVAGSSASVQIDVAAPKADLTITGQTPTAQVETRRSPPKADLAVAGYSSSAQLNVLAPKADLTVGTSAPTLGANPAKADLTVTGYSASAQINVSAPKADLTITGSTPTAQVIVQRSPPKADLTVTGHAPGEGTEAAPGKADLTIAGQAPTLQVVVQRSPPKADLTVAATAASVQLNVAVPKADLTITGSVPVAQADTRRSPPAAALTVSGSAASVQLIVAVAKADLTIAGQTPISQVSLQKLPGQASLSLTGYAASIQLDIAVAKADLTITGQTPDSQVSVQLLPAKADLTVTGYSASVQVDTAVAKADLTLTGYAAIAQVDVQRLPAKADLTVTGYASVRRVGTRRSPAKADLTVTGYAASVQLNTAVAKADLTLTGYAASVQLDITAANASLALTGYAPTAQVDTRRSPAKADLTISGSAATIRIDTAVANASLTITGQAPVAQVDIQRLPAAASLSLAGYAASVQLDITAASASLSIASYVPIATVGKTPASASLTLTGYAASVQLDIAVGKTDLTIVGYAPLAVVGLIPAKADLTLTGYAPIAITGVPEAPAKADLTIATYAASIQIGTSAAVASLSITTYTASVQLNVAVANASLTIAGRVPLTPLVTIQRSPPAAALSIASSAPDLTVGRHQDAAIISIQGYLPTRSIRGRWQPVDAVTDGWARENPLCVKSRVLEAA